MLRNAAGLAPLHGTEEIEMGNAGKGPGMGQDGKKRSERTGVAAGNENGWGGRRHRLGGDGQNVRLTVTLTRCDMDLLESMRAKLVGAVTGSVTETVTAGAGQGVVDGQALDVDGGVQAGAGAGAGAGGSAGLGEPGSNRVSGGVDGIRMGGRVSQAAVIRRALRLLALMEGG